MRSIGLAIRAWAGTWQSKYCPTRSPRIRPGCIAKWRGIELARQYLAETPDDFRAMYLCAGALIDRGRKDEGRHLLERCLDISSNDPATLYNAAYIYARTGEHDRSLELLQACVDAGWGNSDWVHHDPDLDSIREGPRYKAILEQIHAG